MGGLGVWLWGRSSGVAAPGSTVHGSSKIGGKINSLNKKYILCLTNLKVFSQVERK
jgi:hypothetical protein